MEWKFKDFPVNQILREIKFGDFRRPKTCLLTHLEALNLDFYEFFAFSKVEICPDCRVRATKTA